MKKLHPMSSPVPNIAVKATHLNQQGAAGWPPLGCFFFTFNLGSQLPKFCHKLPPQLVTKLQPKSTLS